MLETNDLILRSGTDLDWESLYECFWSRPEAFDFLFQKASPTPEAARKKTASYVQMHREVPTEFFICLKETGKAIGIAGLKQMSDSLYTITDIAMGPDHWGKGYGKQILKALTALALELGAEQISFNCFRENAASRNLALSCGYRYVRTEEAELKKNGAAVLLDYFELTH